MLRGKRTSVDPEALRECYQCFQHADCRICQDRGALPG
ncbi:hypothetical protein D8I24_4599 [Cupriavidus necator H850]|nr:hypothetical protein D8I24_4599 [Cupriavidus necator H850]